MERHENLVEKKCAGSGLGRSQMHQQKQDNNENVINKNESME